MLKAYLRLLPEGNMLKSQLIRAKEYFQFLDSVYDLDFVNQSWTTLEGAKAFTFKSSNGAGCLVPLNSEETLVAVNGSDDVLDFLLDFIFLKSPYDAKGEVVGRVHSGFCAAWELLRKEAMKAVASLDPDKTRTYFFAGHSLGAALAILMCDTMKLQGYTVKECYTSGCPRMGNRALVSWFDSRFTTLRFINNFDVVPALLPGKLLAYHHVGGDASYLRNGSLQSSGRYRYNAIGYLRSGIDDHAIFEYANATALAVANF